MCIAAERIKCTRKIDVYTTYIHRTCGRGPKSVPGAGCSDNSPVYILPRTTSHSHLDIPIWIFHSRHTMTAVTFAFIRFLSIVLTIIFVFGFANDCWCAPPWQWQIGALAVFLAYILFILQLGGMPSFGVYIHMLVNIVITFVKLVFLPFFLILSFAIPFYMLFVRERERCHAGWSGRSVVWISMA